MRRILFFILGLVLTSVAVMPLSIKGRFIGEHVNFTQNLYVMSIDMYFTVTHEDTTNVDTIVVRRRLKLTDKSNDSLTFIDIGILYGCFLQEDSVYELDLIPMSPSMLSEVREGEAFYYKHNCIFPDSTDNRFYEIRSDVMDSYPYPAQSNMYVDLNNRLYKIQELTPNCSCRKLGGYIVIPSQKSVDIKNMLDSLYNLSKQP